jgi:hypothetical protein
MVRAFIRRHADFAFDLRGLPDGGDPVPAAKRCLSPQASCERSTAMLGDHSDGGANTWLVDSSQECLPACELPGVNVRFLKVSQGLLLAHQTRQRFDRS